MKRQSAISAFFRPFDKRIRDSENENESDVRSGSPVDSNPSDQASTSRNEEVARNEESSNNNPTLPVQVDINTLPNKLPTHEGRSLQREWFTDFGLLTCSKKFLKKQQVHCYAVTNPTSKYYSEKGRLKSKLKIASHSQLHLIACVFVESKGLHYEVIETKKTQETCGIYCEM